ncbi:MAG: hypothetical protein Q9162_005982 [Coniocarpon cinnabarinum]
MKALSVRSYRSSQSHRLLSVYRTSQRCPSIQEEDEHETHLWLVAQNDDEIQHDPRWTAFSAHFQISDGTLPLDEILASFPRLGEAENGRLHAAFHKFASALPDYRESGMAIAAADPTKAASFVWGCAQVVATLAINANNTRDAALNHEAMQEIKDRCMNIPQLYISPQTFATKVRITIKRCLVGLYVKIIKYVVITWTYLQKSKITHAIQAYAPSSAVRDALREVHRAEKALKKAVSDADSRALLDVHYRQRKLSMRLESLLAPLQNAFLSMSRIHATVSATEQHNLLKWLSSEQEGIRYQSLLDKHMPGTGAWFLSHDDFNWWQQSNASCTLWLVGQSKSCSTLFSFLCRPAYLWNDAVGSGKSDLAAQAINNLRNTQYGPIAYYFYNSTFAHGIQEFEKSSCIYRCLLKQLMQYAHEEAWQILFQKHADRQLDGSSLTSEEARQCIVKMSDVLGTISIIIDAIDECDWQTQGSFLFELRSMQECAPGSIKLLITGRNKGNLRRFMDAFGNLRIMFMQSEADVQHYITTRIQQDFEKGLLSGDAQLFASQLKQILVGKARGM